MGFLPNGDLILVDHKNIYKYSFINKPTNESLWKYSQIYNINPFGNPFVYQTKLFIFNEGLMTQWDLSTMTLEMQYNVRSYYSHYSMVINKNQTLLALHPLPQKVEHDKQIDIYSMETGVHISRYGWRYFCDIFFIILY